MYRLLTLLLALPTLSMAALPLVPTTVVYLAPSRAPASARVKFSATETAQLRAFWLARRPATQLRDLPVGQRWPHHLNHEPLPPFFIGQVLPAAYYQRAIPLPHAVVRHLPAQPPTTMLFVLPQHIVRLALPSKEIIDFIEFN